VIDPATRGVGPRYFRFQTTLSASTALDDARPRALAQLNDAADRLLAEQDERLREVARRLALGTPLPG
jgi:hypothetical protein